MSQNSVSMNQTSKKTFSMVFFLIFWFFMVFLLYKKLDLFLYPLFILALGFQAYLYYFNKRYLAVLLVTGLLGWSFEALEGQLGLLFISGQSWPPLWLFLLWMYFSSVTFLVLDSLLDRPWKSFLYGVYSLPGAYYLVSKFGIVDFGEPFLLALVVNGTVGGLVLMICHRMLYSFYKRV